MLFQLTRTVIQASIRPLLLLQVAPYASEASVFFHEKEGFADSASVLNISVTCPINAQIRSHNVSLEILTRDDDHSGHHGNDDAGLYRSYKELWYDCISCGENTYSLAGGYFEYTAYPHTHRPNNEARDSNGNSTQASSTPERLVFQQIDCHPCSFGGFCDGGNIYPKVHHWGIAKGGAVEFYACPMFYCCALPHCEDAFDACAENRVGTLCGRCAENYSEAMFSSVCLHNSRCHATWMFPVTFVLAFIYACFLLFQNDLKNFLVGQPKPPKPPKVKLRDVVEAYVNNVQLEDEATEAEGEVNKTNANATNKQDRVFTVINTTETSESLNGHVTHVATNNKALIGQDDIQSKSSLTEKQTEGGVFLIILFYYFQDSSIVYIRATYANVENSLMVTLQDVADSLFKFRIDLSVFVSNVCIMHDVTPAMKTTVKLLFSPALFLILITTALVAQCLKHHSSRTVQKFGTQLSIKTASGMVFAMLFSYQTIAASMFQLTNCVTVNGTSVLFIDGNIECYELWQVVTLVAISLCLIPFSFYIMLAPGHLIQGRLHVVVFFAACLCAPIVSAVVFIYNTVKGRRTKTPTSPYSSIISRHQDTQTPGPKHAVPRLGFLGPSDPKRDSVQHHPNEVVTSNTGVGVGDSSSEVQLAKHPVSNNNVSNSPIHRSDLELTFDPDPLRPSALNHAPLNSPSLPSQRSETLRPPSLRERRLNVRRPGAEPVAPGVDPSPRTPDRSPPGPPSPSPRRRPRGAAGRYSPEAAAVYGILQGPYREYALRAGRLELPLCWSGMLLARRLALVLCDTFVYDLLLRVRREGEREIERETETETERVCVCVFE